MAELKDIIVPDVGGEEVEIIEVCCEVGNELNAEDAFVTVESDKASMDIPIPFDGTVKEISVSVGDKIKEGDLLGKAESGDASGASDTSVSESSKTEEKTQPNDVPSSSSDTPSKQQSSSNGDSLVEVLVPDIGDASDVEIIELLVGEGDTVSEEDGLITLETDKATMDVPAPQAGTIKQLKVNVGDKVSEGSLVLIMSTTESSERAESSQSPQEAQSQQDDKNASVTESSESRVIDVHVPDIGDATDVDVIEVLVNEGDEVEAEDGLITLETDKATMDVPAPQAGTVEKLTVKVGDKVSEGSLVLSLQIKGSSANKPEQASSTKQAVAAPAQSTSADTQKQSQKNAAKAPPVPHHPSAGERGRSGSVYASPSVRRLAREFGVDLTQVEGSGRKKRILKEDVQSYVKYELSRPKVASATAGKGEGGLQVIAPPKVDFSKFGEVEEIPLTRIQKLSGPNLHRNWVTIPHVTQFEEADITDLEDFRKEQNKIAEKRKLGVKITPLVFMMKAVADALKAYPTFNTSLSESGESLIQKKYFHIGIAVDTPNGLVVPVVRDVDKKGIMEISKELMEISIKARDGKLKSADMQGSCFTISSLGGIGGTAFTPIVNAPDVAILGVSKSEIKPKWDGKEFLPRLMLPLSLSYDHRVIDGALAARFAVHLAECLADIRRILL